MGRNSASKRRNKIKSANIRSPIDFSFLPKAIASIQLTKSTKRYANRSTSEETAVNNYGGSSPTNKEATVKSEDEGCSHGSSEWHSNCEGHIKDKDDEKVGELQKNRISASSTTAQKPGDTGTKDSFEEKRMSEGDALQKMPERGGVTNHNNASTVHLLAINVGADLVHCESMEQHLVSNQIQTRACGQKASILARNNSQHDGCTSQVGVIKEAKEKLSAVGTSMEGPEVESFVVDKHLTENRGCGVVASDNAVLKECSRAGKKKAFMGWFSPGRRAALDAQRKLLCWGMRLQVKESC
ncbi:hypothetical protein TEA_017475 [Camellia sinensis var. sinensis]|uniref:Uncharacterized protein n=1 Tax=Camellia sinensis var. sinensis TaxID=542762 RepID=A0A4S4ERM3_CAMSN|nr:hypothetical protein TEA_017475 [Camellia sinensis var. sinensis]